MFDETKEENSVEIILSISGPASTITEIRDLITNYQKSVSAEDPAIFAALLPIEGSSRDEKINWVTENWGMFWEDNDKCPEHLLGDRGTEIAPHDEDEVSITGRDSIEASFYTAVGCPTRAIEQISLKWRNAMIVVGWDDPFTRVIGASMYINGARRGHHQMDWNEYPAPTDPDPNTSLDRIDTWLIARHKALSKATKIAMGLLKVSKDDEASSDDDTYERPVNATGVPSEKNHGEFIIAEVQNGKLSATIVTVPPSALSGNDHIEVFPTMSKYRVLVGVSTEWFDALVCTANGWDPDSDDFPELNEDEMNDSEAMRDTVGLIMAEAMVRIATYFKAKGLV